MSDVIPLAGSSSVPEPDPAQQFLGVRGADANEFTLLGIAPGTATRENVINALRAQLARVAQHPQAASKEAATVRVMLHAAASRLLGPSVAAEPTPSVSATQAVKSLTAFEKAALRLLATHGGMNHVSLKMIRQTAAIMGVGDDELHDVMARLPMLVAQVTTPDANAYAAARHIEAEQVAPIRRAPDKEAGTKRVVMAAAGVLVGGLVLLGGVAYGVRIIFAPKPATNVVNNAGSTTPVTPVAPKGTDQRTSTPDATVIGSNDATKATPAKERTAEELVTALREASGVARNDAERGATEIIAATSGLGAAWPGMPRDYLVASGDAFLDAVYAVQRDEAAMQRVLGALMEQAAQPREAFDDEPARVARAVFARSLLARLLVERDLPASARRTLRDAVTQGLASENASRGPWAESLYDATGSVGRELAKGAQAPARLPPEDAWKVLVSCVRGATPEPERQESQLLATLDHLLVKGQEPTQDQRVLAGVQTLTNAANWSKDGAARAALVVWLSRADVSSADLSVVTSVVAGKPEAEVDRTFMLGPSASDSDRMDLRGRFANVWQTESAGARRDLALTWTGHAEPMLSEAPPTSTTDALRNAVRLAQLNMSAAKAWRGDGVIDPKVFAVMPAAVTTQQSPAFSVLFQRGGDTWGVDYLRAGPDLLKRRDVLRTVSRDPTPLEAKLLVVEAMRGPTQDIRVQARQAIAASIMSPQIAQAMLDFAPFMPPTREASQLVSQATGRPLPSTRSPIWRVEVRRALVWSVLSKVDDGRMADIAMAEGLLSEAYSQRMRKPPAKPLGAVDAIGRVFDELTLDVQAATRLRGQSGDVTTIRTRTRERLRTAEGVVQRFAAYDAGIVELLALAVMNEKPGVMQDVEKVVSDWRREASQAEHIVRQIEASERAQAKLWLLRMKEQA